MACGSNAHAFFYQLELLKQICQSVGLFINRLEEAHLLVAFYHNFNHFVQIFVNWAD